MIKFYESPEGVWQWDTHTGKWTRPPYVKPGPNKIGQVEEVKIPKRNLLSDWNNWNEYLLALFKSARSSKSWPIFLSLHDVSDNRFFSILEFHYINGKLKLEE